MKVLSPKIWVIVITTLKMKVVGSHHGIVSSFGRFFFGGGGGGCQVLQGRRRSEEGIQALGIHRENDGKTSKTSPSMHPISGCSVLRS